MFLIFGLLLLPTVAHAALDLPTDIPLGDLETVGGLMVIAAAAIWVIRKVLYFFDDVSGGGVFR